MELEKDLQRDFAGQPQVTQVTEVLQTTTMNSEMPTQPLHEANVILDCAPPAYYAGEIQNPNVTNTIRPFNAGLTNDEARNALLEHVGSSCCMGKGPANKMEIKQIEYSFTHVLVLETFSEKRQTCWEYKPFRGGHVDDACCGRPPNIWEIIPSKEPTPFKDGKYTTTVPFTEYVQSCFQCNSTGRKRCCSCDGVGSLSCNFCNNMGTTSNGTSCTSCNGRGRRSCFSCNSSGFQECSNCLGSGKLKYYQKLKITWKNHIDEHISEPNFIPKDKLKTVCGDIIYKDQAPRVYPINYISTPDIAQASHSLIAKHEQVYLSKERPLIQQQTVQVIQVATVHYEHNGKSNLYYIFGKESKVYAPNYPSSCCGCTIM